VKRKGKGKTDWREEGTKKRKEDRERNEKSKEKDN